MKDGYRIEYEGVVLRVLGELVEAVECVAGELRHLNEHGVRVHNPK